MIGFSVEIEDKYQVPTILVQGEIDVYTCPQLRSTLADIVEKGNDSFILNLENIHYIDSTGLGTIAHTAQNVSSNEGHIHIICNKPQIKKIFEVSGLEKKNITLYETEADVITAIN